MNPKYPVLRYNIMKISKLLSISIIYLYPTTISELKPLINKGFDKGSPLVTEI